MARGFESKAVADRQASIEPRPSEPREPSSSDPAVLARKRRLELSRADVRNRLALAGAPAHRQMLERALRALDEEIASLP